MDVLSTCILFVKTGMRLAPDTDNLLVVGFELPVDFLPGNFYQQLIKDVWKMLPLIKVHDVVPSFPDFHIIFMLDG